jgi:HrpA-like RNA helicase
MDGALQRVLGLVDADGNPTMVGRQVSKVPASPRLGLMLTVSTTCRTSVRLLRTVGASSN